MLFWRVSSDTIRSPGASFSYYDVFRFAEPDSPIFPIGHQIVAAHRIVAFPAILRQNFGFGIKAKVINDDINRSILDPSVDFFLSSVGVSP